MRPASFAPFGKRHLLETFLDALVLVAEPLFQAQHALADDAETEMPGLDRARVHRSDGNLVHALAFNLHKRIAVLADGIALPAVERFSQRKYRVGPRRVAQPLALIRGAVGPHAKEIVDRALHAVRRRKDVRDVGEDSRRQAAA